MYSTDWHIHTDAFHDASLSIGELLISAKEAGIKEFGITDHADINIPSYWENVYRSRRLYEEYR